MTRALVTGAGHRLGQAMAVYLAGRGYDVAVHYASSSAGADETVSQVEAAGQRGEPSLPVLPARDVQQCCARRPRTFSNAAKHGPGCSAALGNMTWAR